MTQEKKSEIFGCILRQFPDSGIYKITRVTEWLSTNGYSLEKLGYRDFTAFAGDFPEVFAIHPSEGGNTYVIIRPWKCAGACQTTDGHPADAFFGNKDIILNDDIIEMSQQSLYALTKVLGTGLTVQEMKACIYERFSEAKRDHTLNFFGERYTFPIDCCTDGFLVNGIITKNLSPRGKSLYFSFEKTAIFYGDNIKESVQPVTQRRNVSDEDKKQIYRLLAEQFPFDVPQHMAAVSKLLTDNNIDRQKYGCFKMKELLAQMDYLDMEDVILGGVPQIMVTLRKSEEYGEKATLPQHEEQAPKPVQTVAQETLPVPEQPLDEFCNLPPKPVGILLKFLQGRGITKTSQEVREELCADFEKARADGIRFYEGKMIFPCRYLKSDGEPVELTLKRSTYEGKPWFLNYIDTAPHTAVPQKIYPGKLLENFAFLGSWSSFLSELAEKAVPEEWDFADSMNKDLHILIQYIKYTFYRLTKENKICISEDGQLAAFNTGLVDRHYDDLYACFVPNEQNTETKWKFACICTAASRGMGKLLVNYFNPLPQPPQYINRNEDLIFDLSKPVHTDYEHIILDNLKRLPLKFLQEQFSDCPEGLGLISELRTADRYNKWELYDRLRQLIEDESRLFIRIQNRIKDSIELARKRIRWNYKTAVPSYFPKRNSMSLMLPLCLIDEETPDVALVVEHTMSGNYQGQTILTIPQAYIDARLLCSLSSDWLTNAHRSYDEADEEEI